MRAAPLLTLCVGLALAMCPTAVVGETVYLEAERAVGDTVQLSVIRDGEERLISLTLAAQPRD